MMNNSNQKVKTGTKKYLLLFGGLIVCGGLLLLYVLVGNDPADTGGRSSEQVKTQEEKEELISTQDPGQYPEERQRNPEPETTKKKKTQPASDGEKVLGDERGTINVRVRTPDGEPVENAKLKVDFVETGRNQTLERWNQQDYIHVERRTDETGQATVLIGFDDGVRERLRNNWTVRIRAEKDGYYRLRSRKKYGALKRPDPKALVNPRPNRIVHHELLLRKGRPLIARITNYNQLSKKEKKRIRVFMEVRLKIPKGDRIGSYSSDRWGWRLDINQEGYVIRDRFPRKKKKVVIPGCRLVLSFSEIARSDKNENMFQTMEKIIPADTTGKPARLNIKLKKNPDYQAVPEVSLKVKNPIPQKTKRLHVAFYLYSYADNKFEKRNGKGMRGDSVKIKYERLDPGEYGVYVEAKTLSGNRAWWEAKENISLEYGDDKVIEFSMKKASIVKVIYYSEEKERYLSPSEVEDSGDLEIVFQFQPGTFNKVEPMLFGEIKKDSEGRGYQKVILNSFVSSLYFGPLKLNKDLTLSDLEKPSFREGHNSKHTISVSNSRK